MTDYFALLEFSRRPWLNSDELKQKYRQLTLATHPDRPSSDPHPSTVEFATINEAYRVLSDPKLRLQHLLNLEGVATPTAGQSVPDDLSNLFLETGTLVQDIDRLLEQSTVASHALSKSLLRSDLLDKQRRTNVLLHKLNDLYEAALQELKALNAIWSEQGGAMITSLEQIYRRLAYLTRWIEQLEERKFQLSI